MSAHTNSKSADNTQKITERLLQVGDTVTAVDSRFELLVVGPEVRRRKHQ